MACSTLTPVAGLIAGMLPVLPPSPKISHWGLTLYRSANLASFSNDGSVCPISHCCNVVRLIDISGNAITASRDNPVFSRASRSLCPISFLSIIFSPLKQLNSFKLFCFNKLSVSNIERKTFYKSNTCCLNCINKRFSFCFNK